MSLAIKLISTAFYEIIFLRNHSYFMSAHIIRTTTIYFKHIFTYRQLNLITPFAKLVTYIQLCGYIFVLCASIVIQTIKTLIIMKTQDNAVP